MKSVKSKDGFILSEPAEVKRRWEEYYSTLLSEELPHRNTPQAEATAGPISLRTEDEVRRELGKMKVAKAVGGDGVPVEAWKVLGAYGIRWLTGFLNTATAEGKVPNA